MAAAPAGSSHRIAARPIRGRDAPGVAGVLAVLLVVLLSGCAALGNISRTNDGMRAAGFASPSVHVDETNGFTTVSVRYDSGPEGTAAADAAAVVWRTLPYRFDVVDVAPADGGQESFTYTALRQRFGERPVHERSFTSDLVGPVVLVVAAIFAVAAVIAIVIVVVVARARRKRRAALPPWSPPGGGPAWGRPA